MKEQKIKDELKLKEEQKKGECSKDITKTTSTNSNSSIQGQYEDAPVRSSTYGRQQHRGRDNHERPRERSIDRSRERQRSRSRSRGRSSRRKRSYSRSRSRSYERPSRYQRTSNRRSRSRERRPTREEPIRKQITIPRRQRKKSNFDVYPNGVTDENAAAFATQAILQHNMAALQGAVGPASFGGAPPPAAMIGMNNGSTDTSAHPQHTRHARRIYVGGIDDVQEIDLKVFFTDVVSKATGEKDEYVVSVYINKERHFAFVEMSTIELASACMNLDGILFRGNPVKIRRPNDYNVALVPTDLPEIKQFNLAALGIVSTTVGDGPNKMFIGGLPYHLSDEQVKELLQAFGDLKSFHLVRDPGSDISKGYGFCEYMESDVTDKACEGLDNLELGDKKLSARRASNHPGESGNGFSVPDFTGPSVAPSTLTLEPTRILVLKNMVTEEDLVDDDEYNDIVDDIKGECANYGDIVSMVVPRNTGANSDAAGKVFVEYQNVESAKKAADDLHGRGFASRTVEIDYFDESLYASKELC